MPLVSAGSWSFSRIFHPGDAVGFNNSRGLFTKFAVLHDCGSVVQTCGSNSVPSPIRKRRSVVSQETGFVGERNISVQPQHVQRVIGANAGPERRARSSGVQFRWNREARRLLHREVAAWLGRASWETGSRSRDRRRQRLRWRQREGSGTGVPGSEEVCAGRRRRNKLARRSGQSWLLQRLD